MRYQLVGLVDRAATTTNVLSETRYTVCATRTVVSSLLNRLPRTDRRRWWRGGPSSPPVSPPPPPPLPPPTDRSLPPPTDRRTRPIVADRRRFVTLSRRVNTRSSHTLNRREYALRLRRSPRGRRQKSFALTPTHFSLAILAIVSCCFPPYI